MEPSSRRRRAYLRIAAVAVLALLLALLLSVRFLFQTYVVRVSSMSPTILPGDHILALRPVIMGTLHRGDLVAFRFPDSPDQILVKRIVGVPGDRLEIRDKVLFRNDMRTEEPYAIHATSLFVSHRDRFPSEPSSWASPSGLKMLKENVADGAVRVPPGRYFVLGDNRDSSLDSRYRGFVPLDQILARPVMIYKSEENGKRRPDRESKWLERWLIEPGRASRTSDFVRPAVVEQREEAAAHGRAFWDRGNSVEER